MRHECMSPPPQPQVAAEDPDDLTPADREYRYRQRRLIEERARWPERYETVRLAIERGCWPDAYGSTVIPSYLMPPMKFYVPAAGVAHPMHVHGVGAGASLVFWHRPYADERDGSVTPDSLRHERVWSVAVNDFSHPLYPGRFGGHRTFDEALALSMTVVIWMREHYIVPGYRNESRYPYMSLRHWWEVATVSLGESEPSTVETQISMFQETTPERPNTLAATRNRIAQAIDGFRANDHDIVQIAMEIGDIFRTVDLVDRANRARYPDAAPAFEVPAELVS